MIGQKKLICEPPNHIADKGVQVFHLHKTEAEMIRRRFEKIGWKVTVEDV